MIDVFENLKAEQRRRDEERAAAIAFFGESYTNKMPLPKAMKGARPICACCGKHYGERYLSYENKRLVIGESVPRYQGNAYLVYENLSVGAQMGPDLSPGASLTRHTWDGSYISTSRTDPFCTTRCAVRFAKLAHQAGYRIKKEQ